MNPVQERLKSFWGTTLKDFVWDPLTHQLTLTIADEGQDESHTVRFRNVGAFLWSHPRRYRNPVPGWDYAEVTSIGHYPDQEVLINLAGHSTDPEYGATANFALKLWDTLLLIEASEIDIDGVTWVVRPVPHARGGE